MNFSEFFTILVLLFSAVSYAISLHYLEDDDPNHFQIVRKMGSLLTIKWHFYRWVTKIYKYEFHDTLMGATKFIRFYSTFTN